MSSPTAADTPAAAPAFSHQQILQVIFGILLCILLAALDQTVVIPAVPTIAADLNAFGHLSWIVSAYLLTSTASTPIYGKLSDIYGRRALLLPALALFVVSSVLCALSANLSQLILFRALQGLGGGGLMAMAQAAIADVVAPRERGRYQGYMAGTWGVASVAGPVVGGWFTDALSWTYIFWMNVPLGLAAMWLCNRALRILPPRRMGGRIDYLGAAALTGAVTCFLLVLSWGGTEFAWTSWPIVTLTLAAAALFLALGGIERLAADPILPPRMFREPVFTRGVILAFLTSLCLLATTFLLPLYFQLLRGADAAGSGFLVIPYLVCNTVGAFTGGQFARRLGRTKGLILAGLAATCAGFFWMMLLPVSAPLVVVMLPMMIVGFGIGSCLPNVLVMVQNAAERRDVGTATGALLFLRSMGGAFGTTLVGAVLSGIFASRIAVLGFPGTTDINAVQPGGQLATMGTRAREAGIQALGGGFFYAFCACLAACIVAFVVALGLRDIPLRAVSSVDPESQPTLGH